MAEATTKIKLGRYDYTSIETRWQGYWAEHQTFKVNNPGDSGEGADKPKYYILDMFPYPSGSGLHVGHPLGYCATDIVARFKRMCGYNVLHPMGFDSFGLPAEQYAIQTNVHPAETTKKNINTYRRQLKMFGFSYDWDREVATSDVRFYKFTQWCFLQMVNSWYDEQASWTAPDGETILGQARPIAELESALVSGVWGVDESLNLVREADDARLCAWGDLTEAQQRDAVDRHRLAFIDEISVNWCPELGTVLANEEVDNDGRSDRGSHPVYRRPLRQWMLRITKYSERLIDDLDELDWPEPIKMMQRNWVGRSTGAEVAFPLADMWEIKDGQWSCTDAAAAMPASLNYDSFPHAVRVYTTRPDTLFGATYMVLAPEHPIVEQITIAGQRDLVNEYIEAARRRSDMDRTMDTKEKTGVFTGGYAINPVTGRPIPVWVADYVLMGYGTGAIMAVPSGDARDFEFACKFDLEIIPVVTPTPEWIEQRLSAMTSKIDQQALDGFDELSKDCPQLGEEIEKCRQRSQGLGEKTLSVLRDTVGLAKLANHFVSSPRSWGEAFAGEGVAVNSPGEFGAEAMVDPCVLNGLPTSEAKSTIIAWLESRGLGRGAVNYRLRDWVFSRQKYWGEPIPVLHGEAGDIVAISVDELPLELPEMEDFKPTPVKDGDDTVPMPPLGRAKEWACVDREGKSYRRDLNTMPQWAGSCWYYLRFIDPDNTARICDAEAEKYWMPVDLYVGGAEHAVLHLLYARFWHKVLYDLGYVSTREPFKKLFNQGMIQSFAYRDARGLVVGPDKVDALDGDKFALKETGEQVERIVAKMSKGLKNVVNPDEIISQYGADTFRLYEMYMGPLDASKPWNTRDVPGLFKLCQRIWRLVVDEYTGEFSAALCDDAPCPESLRALHKTVKRVQTDVELLKLNTAIAAIFDFVNILTPLEKRSRAVIEPFVLVLAPFAPHLAEELWSRLGHNSTLAYEPWPIYDEALTQDEAVEIAVQVCGKVKARLTVPANAGDDAMKEAALADERVVGAIAGKTIRKVVVVKGRLVNIVAT